MQMLLMPELIIINIVVRDELEKEVFFEKKRLVIIYL